MTWGQFIIDTCSCLFAIVTVVFCVSYITVALLKSDALPSSLAVSSIQVIVDVIIWSLCCVKGESPEVDTLIPTSGDDFTPNKRDAEIVFTKKVSEVDWLYQFQLQIIMLFCSVG